MHKGYAQDSAKELHTEAQCKIYHKYKVKVQVWRAFEVLWVVWAGESTHKFYEHSHPPTL